MPRASDTSTPGLIALAIAELQLLARLKLERLRVSARTATSRALIGVTCFILAAGLAVLVVGALSVAAGLALIAQGIDPIHAMLILAGGLAFVVLILALCGLRALSRASKHLKESL